MDIPIITPCTKGALEKLLMGANGLKGEEAGKTLGDAIAINTVLRELDLSGTTKDERYSGEKDAHRCDAAFAKGFSAGLSTNRALTSLNLASNDLRAQGAKHVAEAIKGHVSAL